MLFFPVSKIFWGLFAPSHLILWCVLAAVLLPFLGRPRAARGFGVAAAVMLILMGVVPSAIWLLRPLEFQYGRPGHRLEHVTGILSLGGGEDFRARLMGTYVLARQYPEAVVVYSGGSNALIGGETGGDAKRARAILLSLGLPSERLILESGSRNTWENILFSRALVKPKPGEVWLLATSAIQMPRAMGVARKLDWDLVAWPTDWRTGQHVFSGYFLIPLNLGLFDAAAREWIGLFAYRLTGKTG